MARTKRDIKILKIRVRWSEDYVTRCERGLVDGRSPIYVHGCKEHVTKKTRHFFKAEQHRANRRGVRADINFQLSYF